MNYKHFALLSLLILFSALFSYAQADGKPKTSQIAPKQIAQAVKSSPAYAEILLRKTERESQLGELLLTYTDEFPKVEEIKFELAWLQKMIDDLSASNAADAAKLSLALGKLMVRETELRVDLWNLHKQYKDDHIEIKRARHRVEIYEKAVKEILP